jgi:hypothetical protein
MNRNWRKPKPNTGRYISSNRSSRSGHDTAMTARSSARCGQRLLRKSRSGAAARGKK